MPEKNPGPLMRLLKSSPYVLHFSFIVNIVLNIVKEFLDTYIVLYSWSGIRRPESEKQCGWVKIKPLFHFHKIDDHCFDNTEQARETAQWVDAHTLQSGGWV